MPSPSPAVDPEFLAMLTQNGYTHVRRLGETCAGLLRLNYTVGLAVGLTWEGHDRRYCYETAEAALAALEAWDGHDHPGGPWIKCKGAGIDLLNPNFGVEVEDAQAGKRSPCSHGGTNPTA